MCSSVVIGIGIVDKGGGYSIKLIPPEEAYSWNQPHLRNTRTQTTWTCISPLHTAGTETNMTATIRKILIWYCYIPVYKVCHNWNNNWDMIYDHYHSEDNNGMWLAGIKHLLIKSKVEMVFIGRIMQNRYYDTNNLSLWIAWTAF